MEPRVQSKHGASAFHCYAACKWNKLPTAVALYVLWVTLVDHFLFLYFPFQCLKFFCLLMWRTWSYTTWIKQPCLDSVKRDIRFCDSLIRLLRCLSALHSFDFYPHFTAWYVRWPLVFTLHMQMKRSNEELTADKRPFQSSEEDLVWGGGPLEKEQSQFHQENPSEISTRIMGFCVWHSI